MITIPTILLTLLIAGLTTESAFIAWVWRQTITRDGKRIEQLEGNQYQTLTKLDTLISPLPQIINANTESLRELRIVLLEWRGKPTR